MVRLTKQKKLLHEEIDKQKTFFNAEELYQKVSKKDKKIGIATIYRFLKSLIEKHQLHSFSCEGKTIYSLDQDNHCHFVCQNCNQIEHLEIKKVDFLPRNHKGEICHFQIDITGTCENCLKEKKI